MIKHYVRFNLHTSSGGKHYREAFGREEYFSTYHFRQGVVDWQGNVFRIIEAELALFDRCPDPRLGGVIPGDWPHEIVELTTPWIMRLFGYPPTYTKQIPELYRVREKKKITNVTLPTSLWYWGEEEITKEIT